MRGRLELPGFDFPLPTWVAILLSLLFALWMINLYNFMDGMDGLAGDMAAIGFLTLGWLGRTEAGFAAFCLTVAAASAWFLIHNFPPAKIFLGDTGSTGLGFLAAAYAACGAASPACSRSGPRCWHSSPFIADATITLLRRLLRGQRVWEPHRTHYYQRLDYQRLVLLGWGHRRTLLVECALMLACAGSVLLAVRLPPIGQGMLAVSWVLIYGLFMVGVGRLERRHVIKLAPQ